MRAALTPRVWAMRRTGITGLTSAEAKILLSAARAAKERLTTAPGAELKARVAGCTECKLRASCSQTVFGVGDEKAEWMLVGEAPGSEEDRLGEPFVGQAGKLLDNMLRAIGLTRQEAEAERQVFIANTLKCRPPRNRNPEPDELAMCSAFLTRQIELVQPRIILAMGRFAVQALLRWYRNGADVQSRLPKLALYMGHVSIASSAYNLHFAATAAEAAASRGLAGQWVLTIANTTQQPLLESLFSENRNVRLYATVALGERLMARKQELGGEELPAEIAALTSRSRTARSPSASR